MNKDNFTEEDLKMYTAALNFIAVNAKFGKMDIKSIIECRNHFAHLQALAVMMATELWHKKLAPFLDLNDWKQEKQGNTLKKVTNRKTGDQIVFLSHSDGSEKNRKHMQGYTAHYVWLDEMPTNTSILEELQLKIESNILEVKALHKKKEKKDK